MKYKFLSLIVIFFNVSCNFSFSSKTKDKNYQFDRNDFTMEKNLHGEIHKLDSLKSPYDICVLPQKNLLLIADMQSVNFVKVYKLDSLKYLTSFGEKGPKENQLLSCTSIQIGQDNDFVYLSDLYKKQFIKYSLPDIKEGKKNIYPEAVIKLQTDVFLRPILLKEKIFDFATNKKASSIYMFNVFNSKGAFVTQKSHYPKVDVKLSPLEVNHAFYSGINKSSNNNNFILNYYNTDYLETYDSLGNLKKRVQGPDLFEPSVKTGSAHGGKLVYWTNKSTMAYTGRAYMDNKNVYVLYDGKRFSEEYHVNTLFKFNKDLVPQISYKLDKPVFVFGMDWHSSTIYCLTHKLNNNYLVKYKL